MFTTSNRPLPWHCANCGFVDVDAVEDVAPGSAPVRAVRVYVAGPLGDNDEGREERVDRAIAAGSQLLAAGLAPFVPHLWDKALLSDELLTYEQWMCYDQAFLDACDAVLRLDGQSPGADREVARMRELGRPVFSTLGDVIAWAKGQA